jgi:hypothetical protein
MMMADDALLVSLNNNPQYDHTAMLNNALHLGDDTGTFSHINLSSQYNDINSLIHTYSNSNIPIFLSINAQSLQSKFNPLLDFISLLSNNKVRIDIIAIQETWSVPYLDLFTIPGYHPPIIESRTGCRGGGVGFYINSNIKYKRITSIPLSVPRTFECICTEIQHNNKPIIISNLYRSPNPPQAPLYLTILIISSICWTPTLPFLTHLIKTLLSSRTPTLT